ncbi:hypothetical protein CEUSTIGMA_g11286.t1 [Chlamydomonas eustigma]|uniref:Uncharacterized protein n=1 Tax=Chlamydomonas eustigma TaxID=1157962 RepID=A0A250XL82_9CHLO|nr:hypothetical protein CEUSTIGMA_g11286.t1 [Chlamydomonas eustigma]|eukprot:GAX83861.1 hypothetical protein CEUSTIGMA_g11286.t1 [Chlamydomonas eustigma]
MGSLWKRTMTAVVQHYLPISFAVALTIALAWPYPGQQVVNVTVLDRVHIVQDLCVGCVFFISGIVLDTQELRRVSGSLSAFVFGLASILFLTPCLGFALRYLPLQPKELCIGLVIFCLVPTTLGVGQALVRTCQGNESVALLLIITSNMLGVLTMPIWVKFMFVGYDTEGLSLNVDIADLLIHLSLTILAPSVVGKGLQEGFSRIKAFAKRFRTHLSLLSTSLLALVIWQTLSGARNTIFQSQYGYILAVIAIASAVHIFYLIANYYALRLFFKVDMYEAVALFLLSSQKSAPVAVTLISYITSDPKVQGLMAVPCITGQLAQIFIGTLISPIIAKRVIAWKESQGVVIIEQETSRLDYGSHRTP